MVTPLCLGAMNFGGPTGEANSIAMINRALDGGINFIDTTNVQKPMAANTDGMSKDPHVSLALLACPSKSLVL